MRRSQFFIPILKDLSTETENIAQRHLLKADYVRQLSSGSYSLLPLGLRVKQNLIKIIREEMNALGGLEFELPSLHPAEVWQSSGRWQTIGAEMFRLKDRNKRDMCLGMTHEEIFATLANNIRSYKELPSIWYQISKKFRDEPRPKGGLLRLREFSMKDSYSFALCQEDLDAVFEAHEKAYQTIFKRCGLDVLIASADNGAMGGSDSKEFMALLESGEDTLVVAPSGLAANQEVWRLQEGDEAPDGSGKVILRKGLELGHIFKLGTRYSEAFNVKLQDKNGTVKPVTMGSYGIGIERLLAAIAETYCDDKGLVWPTSVAPFEVVLLELNDTHGKTEEIYQTLLSFGVNVLFDDRNESAGVKFANADLTGVPWQVVVSARSLEANTVELRDRKSGVAWVIPIRNLYQEFGVN
ncbi:MAG: aminoacyl--tRNA ligase-related protein [Trueperaceae bacterium]